MTPDTVSEAIRRAFRAAFLLTGSTRAAESAVSNGIAELESYEETDDALITKTVEFVIRCSEDCSTLTHLPRELRTLASLPSVSRHCFVLRVLFGVRSSTGAATLDLTLEQFEESLRAAFEELSMPGAFCPVQHIDQKGAHP